MGRGKKLTEFEKGRITAYCNQGLSKCQIANKMKRSKCVVLDYLKNPEKYGTIKQTGRPPIITQTENRHIIRLASNKPTTAREIKADIGTLATVRTIRNHTNGSSTVWEKI